MREQARPAEEPASPATRPGLGRTWWPQYPSWLEPSGESTRSRVEGFRLDGAGGAEAVPGGALGGGDRRLAGVVLAERALDHAGLARVAERRRRAVRVDVVDLLGLMPANAIFIARAGCSPVGSGSLMCSASEETP